jgi:hypothetical protein
MHTLIGVKALSVLIVPIILLTSCSTDSKAAPYLKQICTDWQFGAGYSSGSIETRDNLTNNFSSQISRAVSADPTASAEFQVAINLMKNVAVIEKQFSEYMAQFLVNGSQFYRDLAEKRFNEATAEKAKVRSKFLEICKEYN